jgi:MoaA/NifB/PqqE/SkfB family radical SAM enzyme
VRYRREWFGGALLDPATRATRFYNHAGAYLLEALASPDGVGAPLPSEPAWLAAADDFIAVLIDAGIVTSRGTPADEASVYFTDVDHFADGYLHGPIAVEIELTLRCSRRCTYCAYESHPGVDGSSELSTESWLSSLEYLSDIGTFYVRFTGGDPLVRSDAVELAQHASDLGLGVSISSDLTVLTADIVRQLSAVPGLLAIQTTLDGATAEVADRHRGRGNFKLVTRGLRLLVDANVPVLVGTVVTSENAGDVYRIAELLSQFGPVAYWISPLYEAGRGRTMGSMVPTANDIALAQDLFDRAVNDGLVGAADPAWTIKTTGLDRDERHALWADLPYLVRNPDRLLRVDPQGRCYTSVHLKEILGDGVYFGNLLNRNVLDMWRSAPLLSALRDASEDLQYFGPMIDIRTLNVPMGGRND